MVSEKSLNIRGRLRRLTVVCPECRQVWLAPGLASGDEHVCKRCGAAFVNKGPDAPSRPRDLLRAPLAAAETPAA
ncbi:MAG TPA: hypothetical protein VN228_07365 [Pyrinomonadaceae bacterium]|nr:hypothetical protein [Pyrinomonadaceae bacterium]